MAAASPALPPDCWFWPDVHEAAQEGAGGDDHGGAVVLDFHGRFDAEGLAVPMEDPGDLALFEVEVLFALANPFEPELVCFLVTLRARGPNGRTASWC